MRSLYLTLAVAFACAVAAAPALANTPEPIASGNQVDQVVVNADGSRTVTVQGTWNWTTQQNCPTSRDGVGYQVAWFDNTANPIGQNNSPQGIIYVGSPTDDIVHSLDVLGGSQTIGFAGFDGVPSSYATHNGASPAPTGTDAKNWVSNCNNVDPTTKISSGTWGPVTHTYPASYTGKIQFCPVMYDPHGHGTSTGGTIGSSGVGDITAGGKGANNDNSYSSATNGQTSACPITTVNPPTPHISVGYADYTPANETSATHPTPWFGSQGVTFDGCNYTGTDQCAQANGGDIHDGGAILISAPSGSQGLNVTAASVQIGPCSYNPWPGLNAQIAPGNSLILTQTGRHQCTSNPDEQDNFDTSESFFASPQYQQFLQTGSCSNDGYVPVITLTINGTTTTLHDTGQILNTHGIDPDECTGGANEAENWSQIQ